MKLRQMHNAVEDLLRCELFQPSPLGLLINPFYFDRKTLYQENKRMAAHVCGRVLDVGCGRKPYRSLVRCEEYIGLERDTPENRSQNVADLFYDGGILPVADASFDWVLCNQVLEHVFNPDQFLAEIARVLKRDGGLLLTVPFLWDEHEQPHDFARYSSFGTAFLLQRHGFAILEQRKTLADVRAVFQILNGYIYKVTATKSPYLNLLACMFLIAPFNLLGQILGWLLPSNTDLYVTNVILARKGNPT